MIARQWFFGHSDPSKHGGPQVAGPGSSRAGRKRSPPGLPDSPRPNMVPGKRDLRNIMLGNITCSGITYSQTYNMFLQVRVYNMFWLQTYSPEEDSPRNIKDHPEANPPRFQKKNRHRHEMPPGDTAVGGNDRFRVSLTQQP